jgi:DNA recombination protein RmuC
MIYIFSASILFLLILVLIMLFRYQKLKITSDIANQNLDKKTLDCHELVETKEKLIREVERLSATIKLIEETKEESLKNSKSVLYDLSNSVANKLIEVHKKEVSDSRKQSEEYITKTTESFNNELKKVATLVGALNKDVELSKSVVENIKNSLLSPSHSGGLAELTLENLLKNSGLKKDIDFQLQYSFDNSSSGKLRPDAVVFLPDDNILIIDAKSSQFFLENSSDNTELTKSMNNHLKNLVSKDYMGEISEFFLRKKTNFKRVCTVMFIPTEHALEKISDSDKNFLNKAWQNNVYPAGPTGLMNILSIARMHIGEKLRIENYEQIILEINNIINSVGVLSEHAYKVGSSLTSAVNNYDKFAGSFNRNLISKIKNLKTLGTGEQVKSSKLLERLQIVSSKNEILEADSDEPSADEEDIKKIK